MKDKVAAYLGLCMRMGQCRAGQAACRDAVKKKKAGLVLIDEMASEGTKDQFCALGRQYGVPVHIVPASWQIGKTIGKGERVLVAVTDKHLARAIEAGLQESMIDKEVEA